MLDKKEYQSWLLECTHHALGMQDGSSRKRDAKIQNGHQQDKEARWTGSGMLKGWKPLGKGLVREQIFRQVHYYHLLLTHRRCNGSEGVKERYRKIY